MCTRSQRTKPMLTHRDRHRDDKVCSKGCVERRRIALLVLLVIASLVCVSALASSIAMGIRSAERSAGINAVSAPMIETAYRGGTFGVTLNYWALFAEDGHDVSSDVLWSDDWFFQDQTEYNHDLAHTAAVLSIVANAESSYYQQGSKSPAYAEDAFTKLGFEHISTSSYRYRSEIIDEVMGALDGTDVVAYTLATKRIRSSQTGQEKLLTAVVVRGSYGSEWLSNVKIEENDASVDASDDHLGFTLAAQEIVEDLERRADESDDGLERSYLFCGHSRGGAVANLLASYADGASDEYDAIASASDVRAYTFATPNCTSSDDARSDAYSNIFNIVNPSDLIPQLPLSSWGYSRYGRDVVLPVDDSDAYEMNVDEMRDAYERTMGTEYPDVSGNEDAVVRFVSEIGDEFGSFDDLVSPAGVAKVIPLIIQSDIPKLLVSHYPNTYIAWLEATNASDLVQVSDVV